MGWDWPCKAAFVTGELLAGMTNWEGLSMERVAQRLLGTFFSQTWQQFYVNELHQPLS